MFELILVARRQFDSLLISFYVKPFQVQGDQSAVFKEALGLNSRLGASWRLRNGGASTNSAPRRQLFP
jgi:hypothetical protein